MAPSQIKATFLSLPGKAFQRLSREASLTVSAGKLHGMIFAFVFTGYVETYPCRTIPGVLLVSKQIYAEARGLYYWHTTFVMDEPVMTPANASGYSGEAEPEEENNILGRFKRRSRRLVNTKLSFACRYKVC